LSDSDKKKLPPWLWLLILAVLAVGFWLLVGRWVTMDDVRRLAEAGQAAVDENPLPVLGMLFAALLVTGITTLPLKAVLTVLAGALFGPIGGSAITMVAILLGTSITFQLVRRYFRERVAKSRGKLARKLEQRFADRPIRAMAGLRLMITLPYGPITLAAAVTSIKYREFLLGSFIGDLPVIVLYSMAGERLATLASTSEAISPLTVVILVAAGAVLLIATFFGGKLKE
jgi:uncharacterized membrane protein YdjX (TVP38/TMEM64 family)